MIYDLSNPYQRQAFITKCKAQLSKNSVIEFKERITRTRNQNSYLHLLIGAVAMETGVTVEYCKQEYFKKLVNRDLFVRQAKDKFAGDVELIRSTAELTKEEMSVAIDRFKRWGLENGIYLPAAADGDILRLIEIEMGRCASYIG